MCSVIWYECKGCVLCSSAQSVKRLKHSTSGVLETAWLEMQNLAGLPEFVGRVLSAASDVGRVQRGARGGAESSQGGRLKAEGCAARRRGTQDVSDSCVSLLVVLAVNAIARPQWPPHDSLNAEGELSS